MDTLLAFITSLILTEYFVFVALVGKARIDYDIPAPLTSGHPVFERKLRAQQNTAEQLVQLIPALWIFGTLVDSFIAAALGGLFFIGRIIYFVSYSADPTKRNFGFTLGGVPVMILVFGSLIAATIKLLGV